MDAIIATISHVPSNIPTLIAILAMSFTSSLIMSLNDTKVPINPRIANTAPVHFVAVFITYALFSHTRFIIVLPSLLIIRYPVVAVPVLNILL